MSTMVRRPGFEYMALGDFEDLLADKPIDEKWELIGGRVVRAPAGARWEHRRIVQNVMVLLVDHIRRTGSRTHVFTETFPLKQKHLDLAALPDVMVRHGQLPAGACSLDDPVILMEIVSPGSAQRDRIEKWDQYRHLDSLRRYALIDRDRMHIEVFERTAKGWALDILDAEGSLALPEVGAVLPLSDIYLDVRRSAA